MHLCNHYLFVSGGSEVAGASLASVKGVCVGMHIVWVQWGMFLWFASHSVQVIAGHAVIGMVSENAHPVNPCRS